VKPLEARRRRHTGLVRVTHWITAAAFLGLLVSGIAILLAHPRLYWGETGALGGPSLLDLPLPLILVGQSGWGRSLHFLSAWVLVATGLVYIIAGVATGHFRTRFAPSEVTPRAIARGVRNHLLLKPQAGEDPYGYNVLQRLAYLAVVFVLFPLMVWTGLAMSPAITSVAASLVTTLGGQQSARTIHFGVASLLVVFVVIHVMMVAFNDFGDRMRAMVLGRGIADRGRI
jgi:thiosulfate reductase cytochrome b subunit